MGFRVWCLRSTSPEIFYVGLVCQKNWAKSAFFLLLKIIVIMGEYFGIFSKLFCSSKLKTCDNFMGPKIGPIISYFPTKSHFSASSKIGKLNWKYSDLWICILNRYFGSGLGSRHALTYTQTDSQTSQLIDWIDLGADSLTIMLCWVLTWLDLLLYGLRCQGSLLGIYCLVLNFYC